MKKNQTPTTQIITFMKNLPLILSQNNMPQNYNNDLNKNKSPKSKY